MVRQQRAQVQSRRVAEVRRAGLAVVQRIGESVSAVDVESFFRIARLRIWLCLSWVVTVVCSTPLWVPPVLPACRSDYPPAPTTNC